MQCIKRQVLPRQTRRSEAEFPLLLRDSQSGSSPRKYSHSVTQGQCHSMWTRQTSLAAMNSLGQILYTTTLDLGFIFNLSHLLRNLFFLQRVKIIRYYLPLSGVSFSFEGKVGHIPHKAWLRTRKGHSSRSSSNLDTTKPCGQE